MATLLQLSQITQRGTPELDVGSLEAAMRGRIRGEVRFDAGSRGMYATDASNYRQVPIGVVVPREIDDVIATVAVCRDFGAPVLARGGGTSLAGQCCNVAVVLDFSKYLNRVLKLDPENRRAVVQPGTVLDDLRRQTLKHHLTFGPDPATHTHCVLGGMIGNNSCGIHSVMAGKTVDNVEEMEILTYDGLRMRVGATSDEQYEQILAEGGRPAAIYGALRSLRDRYADEIRRGFPQIPRRVSGFNLDQLLPENGFHVARALVGSEGTCATILEATLRLVYDPPCHSLLVIGYPDVYSAADHVPQIMEHSPIGLEGMDDRLVGYMNKKGLHPEEIRLLPKGKGWLLAEFGGDTPDEARQRAEEVQAVLKRRSNPPTTRVYVDPAEQTKVWEIRESGLGATAFVPGDPNTWPGWEDSAVAPEKLGEYLRKLRELFQEHGYDAALYGHFGQGCVHCRINFDLTTHAGLLNYRAFVEKAADLVICLGGSLSGEHGDGQARGELLPKMYGPELMNAFREFKAIWDPDEKMNPGKVIDAARIDENLRLGTDYRPWEPETHFQYPDDSGSFAHATLRCVGVGKCRRMEGGTMCPSYMVTREEKHTTRGRAHLLFEMLQGDPVTGGWQNEDVKDALDLCLSCKGCKGDCPVNVDIATYKAEFLSHYHEKRWRPRQAYSMGLVYYWSRLASLMPGLANAVAGAPLVGRLAKWAGGIVQERPLPRFAPQTFRRWFSKRPPRNVGKPQVMLWPDCFNNFFDPQVARAGVEVLEEAGYEVVIPPKYLCCGRPLYEYGMLDLAKSHLRQVLDVLQPQIEAGISMVALEPSCASVFRDEMTGLFPHDQDALRLHKQTFLLSEFLHSHVKDYPVPKLHRKAIVHGHCHHKAIMKTAEEEALLREMGLDIEVLDSGCCGMAGSFGFEPDKYEVSMACGERVLLPAVRNAPKDALILTDGFSCREQIAQTTDRQALHLAQVLRMARQEGPAGPEGEYPERGHDSKRLQAGSSSWLLIAATVGLGIVALGGLTLWKATRAASRT